MADASIPSEIFAKVERMLENEPERIGDLQGVYKIVLEGPMGGTWMIDLRENSRGVRMGDGNAHCTLLAKTADFMKLVRGEMKPAAAIIKGKIKLQGDVSHAMKIAGLFKR